MKKKMKTVLLFIMLSVLAFAPSAVFAAMVIGTPILTPNKGTYSSGDQIIVTIPVTSQNDTTGVVMEVKNSTSDLSNSTYLNYTLILVGSRTNGNWIYTITVFPGIYQITRVFVTDNSSFIQVATYDMNIIGFRVVSPTTTTTTTAANATTTTTTMTNITTQATTSTSSQTPAASPLGGTFLDLITSLFTNPVYILLITLIIIVPIIIWLFFKKKTPKDVLPEPQQEGSTYST